MIPNVIITGTVDTAVSGEHIITYTCTDASGNGPVTITRTVTVSDGTSPTLTLLGADNIRVRVGGTYDDEGATCQDAVDGNLTSRIDTVSTVNLATAGTYTVTYTCADNAGNSPSSLVRNVTVVDDNTPPTILLNGNNNTQIIQDGTYTEQGATCTDDFDGVIPNVIITGTVDTAVSGEHIITYTCTDASGNGPVTITRTVTVSDGTSPTLTLLGADNIRVRVGGTYNDEGATCQDAVEGNLTSRIDTVSTVDLTTAGTYTVTYTCADDAGNPPSSLVRNVTVVDDNTPPTIILNGNNNTQITQDGTYTEQGATCTDDFDGVIPDVIITGTVDTAVSGEHIITYTCTDASGNGPVTITRTVTVSDGTSPTLTLLGADNIRVRVGGTYNDEGATCQDAVEGNLTSRIDTVSTVDLTTAGTYTVTYTCADDAGNPPSSLVRNVTVVDDNTPPTIILNGNNNTQITQDGTYTEQGATCTDDFDGVIPDVIITGTVDTAVSGEHIITYTCTDASGNGPVTITRTVTVLDGTFPVLTLLGADNIRVRVGGTYDDEGATCQDAVDGNLTSRIDTVSTVNLATAGTYTVTYTCADNAGNSPSSLVRNVTVVDDNTPPTILLNGNNNTQITQDGTYTEQGATCTDDFDGDITSTITITGTVDPSTSGEHIITYTCTDASGNGPVTITRTVTVLDGTSPVLTLLGADNIRVRVGGTYDDEGATCQDAVDGNLTSRIDTVSTVNLATAGTYTVTYTCADDAGNPPSSLVRNVTVVDDNTPPTILLNGNNNTQITQDGTYTEQGATCTDDFDGDITSTITITGTVDTSTSGEHIITYTCTDVSGNGPVTITRTVTVLDGTSPVLTLLGEDNIRVRVGGTYNDEGATCQDAVDGNLTSRIDTVSTVNLATAGTYTVTYTCADDAGNPPSSLVRNVTVVDDNTPPTIILNGNNNTQITQDGTYTEQGATCTDDFDGDITSTITITGTVDTSTSGEHIITYTCTDASGNGPVTITRTVTVVAVDDTPPTFSLNGDDEVFIMQGSTYTELGATCNDTVDGDITPVITGDIVLINTVGIYTITYNCSDVANNAAPTLTRTVNVVAADTTLPVITLNGDAIITIIQGGTYTELGATCNDNIDGDITTIATDSSAVITSTVGSYQVTYDCQDTAGNNATQVIRQVIVIVPDTTLPVVLSGQTDGIASISLTFSEDITIDSPLPVDFTISGLSGFPAVSQVLHASENSIKITFTNSVFSDTDFPIILSYIRTSGSINDLAGNTLADFASFEITNNLDTSRPIPVIALDPPGTFTPTTLSLIPITVTFSESVSELTQSGITVTGGIISSLTETTPSDGTTYRAEISPSLTDGTISVMVLSGKVTDDSSNGNVATTFDILVDSVGPTIISAETLSSTTITLQLSEPVTINDDVSPANFVISGINASLTPAQVADVELLSDTASDVIKLTLDATTVISDTDTLVISYTNSAGAISDVSGNTLSDFDDFVINNNEQSQPTISSVYATVPDGTYLTGETVEIAVLFTKPVTVNTSTADSLSLLLKTGPENHTAIYSGTAGSSSNVLTFSYTVLPRAISDDLQYTGIAALTLMSGTTITESDISGTVDARLILPELSSNNSLASNSDIAIDGIPTRVIAAEIRGQNTLEISYNRAVTVKADHYENLVIGGDLRSVENVLGSDTTDVVIVFSGSPTNLNDSGTVDIDTHVAVIGQTISARSENTAFTDNNPVVLITDDIVDNLTITDNTTTTSITPALGLYLQGTGSNQILPSSVIRMSFDHDADNIADVYVTFAPNTVVSNLGPDGTIPMSLSAKTVMYDVIPSGFRLANSVIVDLGDPTRDLLLDNPVSIDLVNRAGETGFFVDAAGSTNTVSACNTNHADAATNTVAELVSAKVELRTRGINECSVSVGDDLRFYSLHLSGWGTFDSDNVPDVLPRNRNIGSGGGGGGGGSGGSTPPSFTTSFGKGADTIMINNVGIAPKPFKLFYTQDKPVTIMTDRLVPFSFILYDDESWQSITHLELCINTSKPHSTFCDGDTKVIWDKNNNNGTPKIIDPNNVIDTASVSISKESLHVAIFDFEIMFDGPVDTTDLQIRSWDAKNNTLEFTIKDALVVTDLNESNKNRLNDPVVSDGDTPDNTDGDTPDNTDTTHTDTSNDMPDDSNTIPSTPGDLDSDRKLIISMWVGLHNDSATDEQLLHAFDVSKDTSLPDWFKSDLGTWVAHDRVSLQEFDAALQYMTEHQNNP